MVSTLTAGEEAQLLQTIEMFEVITQSQPQDYQSLEILKEAYFKLGRDQEVMDTSKRIAQAYVLMGQFSSAILEYETILQRFPDDPDVLEALGEIESKANSLNVPTLPDADSAGAKASKPIRHGEGASTQSTLVVDDGRSAMFKVFVEGKVISAGDFDLCWPPTTIASSASKAAEPFIQLLADKGLHPLEQSLKLLCDKTRLSFLPIDRYDFDVDFARSFPTQTCLRWCVLPLERMSKSILVATANPFNRQAVKELEEASQHRVLWYLAPPPDLLRALRKTFR